VFADICLRKLFLYGEITTEVCPSTLDTFCVLEMRGTGNESLIRKLFVFSEDCAEISAIVGFCATQFYPLCFKMTCT
jgi:hypothetical protein